MSLKKIKIVTKTYRYRFTQAFIFGFQGASFKDRSSLVNKSEFGDDVDGKITKLKALKLLRIILHCIIRKKKTARLQKNLKK